MWTFAYLFDLNLLLFQEGVYSIHLDQRLAFRSPPSTRIDRVRSCVCCVCIVQLLYQLFLLCWLVIKYRVVLLSGPFVSSFERLHVFSCVLESMIFWFFIVVLDTRAMKSIWIHLRAISSSFSFLSIHWFFGTTLRWIQLICYHLKAFYCKRWCESDVNFSALSDAWLSEHKCKCASAQHPLLAV